MSKYLYFYFHIFNMIFMATPAEKVRICVQHGRQWPRLHRMQPCYELDHSCPLNLTKEQVI